MHVSAYKDVVACGYFITIPFDVITCNSLILHMKPYFLCTRVIWRDWIRIRAKHTHLKLLNDLRS